MPPEITDTTSTAENTTLEAEAKAKAKAEAKAAEKAKAEKAKAEEAAKSADLAEQEAAAKLQAEEEKPLDMSLDARMARAKDALAEAIDAQNQINRIVAEKTKELDELIIEQTGSPDNNPMTEIQFYLTAQQRKREQKAEQRKQMLDQGVDAAELIRRLDGRAPVDQRPPLRKVHPIVAQAVKTNAA